MSAAGTIPHSRSTIGPEDLEAVCAQLRTGLVAQGDAAERLAGALAGLAGAAGAVGCGSGSQALDLSLKAAGVRRGARVAMPSYVCPEVLGAVMANGATPEFLDIAEDLLVDHAQALRACARCDALILPYLFGRWRDYSDLRGRGAVIIEDFAQCLATRSTGFPGMTGDFAVFSLQATKVVCAGEGGVAAAAWPEGVERLRALKLVDGAGCPNGMASLSDLCASLGLSQLLRLEAFTLRRREIAARYDAALAGAFGLARPPAGLDFHFRYPLLLPAGTGPDALRLEMQKRGVAVRRPVDTLSHRVFAASDEGLAATCRAYESVISLPIYPSLSEAEQATVIDALLSALGEAALPHHRAQTGRGAA